MTDAFKPVTALAGEMHDEALLPGHVRALSSNVRDILARIDDRVLPALEKVSDRLLELEHQQAAIFDRLGKIDGRIDGLALRLRSTARAIDGRVTAVERRTRAIEKAIAAIEKQLAKPKPKPAAKKKPRARSGRK